MKAKIKMSCIHIPIKATIETETHSSTVPLQRRQQTTSQLLQLCVCTAKSNHFVHKLVKKLIKPIENICVICLCYLGIYYLTEAVVTMTTD